VIDRLEEAQRAFLDEIVERESEAAITCRDRAHEPEIREDEPLPRAAVAGSGSAEELAGATRVTSVAPGRTGPSAGRASRRTTRLLI
jgi:hypothetical protein